MTARPATAAVSIGHKQPPPHPRRSQHNSSNGLSARSPALRSLHSHPPASSSASISSHRPRFSPYTPPLSSAIPISSHRAGRTRHATVSTDLDITDPRIYPTELSSSRDQQEAHAAAMSRSYDCAFFSGAAAGRGHGRRGEFVIHPEWLSESVSIERLRINERPLIMPTGSQLHQQQYQHLQQQQPPRLQHQQSVPSNWPKRCKSAPPPPQQQQQQQQIINPITWQ